VCGKTLDVSEYEKIFAKFHKNCIIERFDDNNFKNRRTYSDFCLSKTFYERFSNYKYMLIYQLDAWVFKDELEYWCKQDYDYIGAPWKLDALYELTGVKVNCGGNGGFSLRKIDSMLDLINLGISSKKALSKLTFWEIFKIIEKRKGKFRLRYLWKSLTAYIFQKKFFGEESENEDLIIAKNAGILIPTFKFPTETEAARFSIESFHEYYYDLINHEFPFGAHNYFSNKKIWDKLSEKTQ